MFIMKLHQIPFKCKNCFKIRKYLAHVAHLKSGCKQDKYLCQVCLKFEGSKKDKDVHILKCIQEVKNQHKAMIEKVKSLDLENKTIKV